MNPADRWQDSISRLHVVAVLLLVACRSDDVGAQRSPQADSIRAAWADQLVILASDDRYAVSRNDAHLMAFRRDREDAWRMSAELLFAPDWRSAIDGGFTTYVDADRLREAYGRYLDWCANPAASPGPWSSRSPLAARTSHEGLILVDRVPIEVDDRDWSRLEVRCFGAEGRYAWFVVTNVGRFYSDGYCGWVTREDRLIVFRADDGRNWLIHDEAALDDCDR